MKKIQDIINRLWNVCGQMEVGALLTCRSGIKAFIPDPQVNNAPTSTSIWLHTFHKWSIMAGICSLFQLFPETVCGCFFIISHRKDLEISKSSIWKRKKLVKWQRLRSRADLNRRPFAQESSVYSPRLSASSRLQAEKNRWNHFGDRHQTTCTSTALASVRYAQTQSFRFALFE